MPKIFQHFIVLTCLVAVLILPYFVFAQSPTELLRNTQPDSGYQQADETTLPKIIGKVINAFLGLLGIIFITLMLYGGYNWMTASGDEGKLSRAKDTIRRAIIGLIITLGSYAIWNLVIYSFVE